ncbi:AraC family transcriptional regulator N-terminal domain-containing protein [Pseudanabaena sp. FACHB-2040]
MRNHLHTTYIQYDRMHYLLATVVLSVASQILEASKAQPYFQGSRSEAAE